MERGAGVPGTDSFMEEAQSLVGIGRPDSDVNHQFADPSGISLRSERVDVLRDEELQGYHA